MPFYEKGDVRIYYEDTGGSGFPLLVIPGGGLNATIAYTRNTATAPFDATAEFKNEYRCIAFDLRNANGGQSSGPLEIDRPWDAYTDDMLGLLDHLGISEFMALGYCIGGPFIWNLLRRAGRRVVAAVPTQPSGFRPTMPNLFYENNIKGWAPALCARLPDPGIGAARRRAGPSLRHRDGERLSRAQCAGEPLPVEGQPGKGPPRGAPRAHLSEGEPAELSSV